MPISILACPYRYWTSDVEHLVVDATVVALHSNNLAIKYLLMATTDARQQTADSSNDRIIEEHRRLFNLKVEELVRAQQTSLLTKEEYDHIVYVLDQDSY